MKPTSAPKRIPARPEIQPVQNPGSTNAMANDTIVTALYKTGFALAQADDKPDPFNKAHWVSQTTAIPALRAMSEGRCMLRSNYFSTAFGSPNTPENVVTM